MALIFSIIVTTLVIRGVLALLDWWIERAGPNRNGSHSKTRRSFMRLIVSLVGGAVIGSYVWYRSKTVKQDLQLLFELELLLAQLDGLVNAAIAQGDATKILPSIEVLVEKLGKYGDRTHPILSELEDRLSPYEYADLRYGAAAIAAGYDKLETAVTRNEMRNEIGEFLITMQKGIRQARTKTRELIDARISSF